MRYVYNDGGRAAAGWKGSAGDCVTRAVCIAAELPYDEVYERLSRGMQSQRTTRRSSARPSARNGVNTGRKWFKDYMAAIGFTWTPTMSIGSGCRVHLRDGELPTGRLVVRVSSHLCAVIDGVIHDTFDPSDTACTIYPPHTRPEELPNSPALRKLDNGSWAYRPDRCVYGYWTLTP
jgi:hypothetical protein